MAQHYRGCSQSGKGFLQRPLRTLGWHNCIAYNLTLRFYKIAQLGGTNYGLGNIHPKET
jgi:hypothetical protein